MNNLRDEKTFWMFLLSSRNAQPEKNHIRDVGFGLYCLEKAGIDKNDIILVIDCTPPDQVESVLKEFTNQTYVIHSSSELGKLIEGNVDYKNMVLFVFGHGSQSGIASNPKDITPYKLYSSIKQSKSLETATVYLGQCYAGLFNHMNAQACLNEDGTSSPGIIVLGATGLHYSISSPTTENINGSNVRWSANIFLYYVFLWFKSPLDKDGDLHFTIMDSYKYAGLMTNDRNGGLRIENFTDKLRQIQRTSKKIKVWKNRVSTFSDAFTESEKDLRKLLKKKVARNKPRHRGSKVRAIRRVKKRRNFFLKLAGQSLYELRLHERERGNTLEIFLFNSQEAWVLHSLLAQEVEFSPKTII